MTSLMLFRQHSVFHFSVTFFVTPDNKYSVSICDPRRVFSLQAHFSLFTSSYLENDMAVADELKSSTWPLEQFFILTLVAYDNFFSHFPQNNYSSEAGFTNCKQKLWKIKTKK